MAKGAVNGKFWGQTCFFCKKNDKKRKLNLTKKKKIGAQNFSENDMF